MSFLTAQLRVKREVFLCLLYSVLETRQCRFLAAARTAADKGWPKRTGFDVFSGKGR